MFLNVWYSNSLFPFLGILVEVGLLFCKMALAVGVLGVLRAIIYGQGTKGARSLMQWITALLVLFIIKSAFL